MKNIFKIFKWGMLLQLAVFLVYIIWYSVTFVFPIEYFEVTYFILFSTYVMSLLPDFIIWFICAGYLFGAAHQKFIVRGKLSIFEWMLLLFALFTFFYISYGHYTGELGAYM